MLIATNIIVYQMRFFSIKNKTKLLVSADFTLNNRLSVSAEKFYIGASLMLTLKCTKIQQTLVAVNGLICLAQDLLYRRDSEKQG